jgi:hypothetical protein
MTENTFFKRYPRYQLYILTVLVVGIIVAGGITSMTSSVHIANALEDGLPHSENNDKLSKIIKWQKVQFPNTFLDRPQVELVSNLGNTMTSTSVNSSALVNSTDPVVQDIMSRLSITGRERGPTTPEYRLTQVNQSGNPDYRIFYYVWKEDPQHYDIEAIVGVNPIGDEYYVEITRLTIHSIDVSFDGNLIGTMETEGRTPGEAGFGYVTFRLPR